MPKKQKKSPITPEAQKSNAINQIPNASCTTKMNSMRDGEAHLDSGDWRRYHGIFNAGGRRTGGEAEVKNPRAGFCG